MIKLEKGQYIRSSQVMHSGHETKSIAIYEYQKSIMELGIKSLDSIEPNLREIQTMTYSIDPKKIPELKQLIRTF